MQYCGTLNLSGFSHVPGLYVNELLRMVAAMSIATRPDFIRQASDEVGSDAIMQGRSNLRRVTAGSQRNAPFRSTSAVSKPFDDVTIHRSGGSRLDSDVEWTSKYLTSTAGRRSESGWQLQRPLSTSRRIRSSATDSLPEGAENEKTENSKIPASNVPVMDNTYSSRAPLFSNAMTRTERDLNFFTFGHGLSSQRSSPHCCNELHFVSDVSDVHCHQRRPYTDDVVHDSTSSYVAPPSAAGSIGRYSSYAEHARLPLKEYDVSSTTFGDHSQYSVNGDNRRRPGSVSTQSTSVATDSSGDIHIGSSDAFDTRYVQSSTAHVPISATRRKIRKLLCQSKRNPRYFD